MTNLRLLSAFGVCLTLMGGWTERVVAQAPCGAEGFASRCATRTPNDYSLWESPCFDGPVTADYPLNLALWTAFGPPDLPPKSVDPWLSSAPLVAADAKHRRGPNPYASRPTVAGLVDLITGAPLYQETDFSLPVGGATFRHVRTHADNVTLRFAGGYHVAEPDNQFPPGVAWDWNGQYWMMSENPILLIDAHLDQLNPNETMSYLIMDMHHSIPFRKVGDAYVAPSWFDGVMWHDGQDPPTEYYVSLDRGAVTYHFSPRYEDVGTMPAGCANPNCIPGTCENAECQVNAHLPPSEGGYGSPYYGLLTRIEDRNGNRAEIEYVEFREYDCGRASGCCQNCNEKGQTRSVRLYPGGSATAEWTLVYTHRPFLPTNLFMFFSLYGEPPDTWELWQQHQLHSIHVYHRDVPASALTGLATLPVSTFYPNGLGISSFDEYDAIDEAAICGLPADWVIRADISTRSRMLIGIARTSTPAETRVNIRGRRGRASSISTRLDRQTC